MSLRVSIAIALFLSVVGCSKDNPEYCAGHPEDTANCAPDATPRCTGDGDCSGSVCEIASGACVQCTTSNASACTGSTPICSDDDHTCGGCTTHDECSASDVCLPTGACADAADVAYVSSAGSGTGCTQAAPCPLLSSALATNKGVIKIAADGARKDTAPVTIDGKAVTIVAARGAMLDRDGDGPILEVKSQGANVVIYDLHITGASGTGADGILLSPNGGTPTLSLVRVAIDGNQGVGISASGGSLTVSQSTISQNTGGGISAASGTTFDINNCVIARNGAQDADLGGVSLSGTAATGRRFEFNTVVDNRASSSALRSGGVLCDVPSLSAANNIIARNQSGSSTIVSNAQTLGACTFPTSKIQADLQGLGFLSPESAPFSYKLTAGSSAIDAATTTSTVVIDFDGDARPQGAAKDVGADELVP